MQVTVEKRLDICCVYFYQYFHSLFACFQLHARVFEFVKMIVYRFLCCCCCCFIKEKMGRIKTYPPLSPLKRAYIYLVAVASASVCDWLACMPSSSTYYYCYYYYALLK